MSEPVEESAAWAPLRLVLDTNVVVAGLLWQGPPRRLLDLAVDSARAEFFSSQVLRDELAHALNYPNGLQSTKSDGKK